MDAASLPAVYSKRRSRECRCLHAISASSARHFTLDLPAGRPPDPKTRKLTGGDANERAIPRNVRQTAARMADRHATAEYLHTRDGESKLTLREGLRTGHRAHARGVNQAEGPPGGDSRRPAARLCRCQRLVRTRNPRGTVYYNYFDKSLGHAEL